MKSREAHMAKAAAHDASRTALCKTEAMARVNAFWAEKAALEADKAQDQDLLENEWVK